ncbi:UDP-N-acetylmuramoyl-L-alanyl-D-glutamate--2,6-diaminopimelate ligase [Aciditerrimonas ferrireducens]|uniref:UDP-N-acetylmuramoyl-L-alanyl-D-glutamate--2, 6-diaminopimelate ligase n=1 Tax=Aciditerrimonas ferrireducens TaxID=667306 RepID=UPI0020064195|nr:UDP-N-acetylmuramoyl-L-alanyl-D-glutamate--2,6-diaminopimelate ligase [Aciditerrimonas ferrireducens]MCK4178208.1 UDP-N-acetylmuramoyl-L-alanyl-D-glutamate--2,6-diaminopimelate ligase [Aciditerrimonas ferrireducens]
MDHVLAGVPLTATVGDLDRVDVQDLAIDHRAVTPGSLFVCVPGTHDDGHRYAAQAVARGAVGVVAERLLDLGVPLAVVRRGSARAVTALAARRVHGDPSRHLAVIGVTGTNGKTSVTALVAAALGAAGWPCRAIGTLSGARTTPEAPDLQRQLAQARQDGCRAVAVEVSSHALAQQRVAGTRFAAGVFTNLGRDHLDYHGTQARYFEAKARLFLVERCELAVVNVADPAGARLAALVRAAGVPLVPVDPQEAEVLSCSASSLHFRWRARTWRVALPGRFQLANVCLALAAAMALGADPEAVAAGLVSLPGVPGRFEVVLAPPEAPFTGVVDYAHTPDALGAALASCRSLAGAGRVLCVFGAGGGRDEGKRPQMGQVAASQADVVVLTSDNTRGEDPWAIARAVLEGTDGEPAEIRVELDRRRAIELAVTLAAPGDVVLVAGKGHETALDHGDRQEPFDDRQELRVALGRLRDQGVPWSA